LQLSGGGSSFVNQQKAIGGRGVGTKSNFLPNVLSVLPLAGNVLNLWATAVDQKVNGTPEMQQLRKNFTEALQAPSIFSHLAKEEKLGISEPKVSLNQSTVSQKVDKKGPQQNEKKPVINFYSGEEFDNESGRGGNVDIEAQVINKKTGFVKQKLKANNQQEPINLKGEEGWTQVVASGRGRK
jgi:hypothetical protein